MAVGLQKAVRRGILPLLKADGELTALVPSDSINSAGPAAWPFITLRAPATRPLKAACVNGGLVTWDIHAFAGPRRSGGQDVETAEDHAGSIGAHIERVLADQWIELEGGARARLRLSDIRLLEDGDVDHFHWFAQINARVLAA
jgi:hypothetical protein